MHTYNTLTKSIDFNYTTHTKEHTERVVLETMVNSFEAKARIDRTAIDLMMIIAENNLAPSCAMRVLLNAIGRINDGFSLETALFASKLINKTMSKLTSHYDGFVRESIEREEAIDAALAEIPTERAQIDSSERFTMIEQVLIAFDHADASKLEVIKFYDKLLEEAACHCALGGSMASVLAHTDFESNNKGAFIHLMTTVNKTPLIGNN